MNALVATSDYRSPHRSHGDVVSPELVLVDEVLAASARDRLPEAPDSLARPSRPTRPSYGRSEAHVALATAASEPADERDSQPRSWGVAAGVAAAIVVVVLLLDVHVQVGRTPASAESTAIDTSPATTPTEDQQAQSTEAQQSSSGSGPAHQGPAPEPRRFAWAPTANASGYHIELFRGTKRVFSADTKRAQITIPAYWTLGGRRRSLTPGDYRWYVWSEVSGRRTAQAIVQANLVIPFG